MPNQASLFALYTDVDVEYAIRVFFKKNNEIFQLEVYLHMHISSFDDWNGI